MFYVVELDKDVDVKPRYFGEDIQTTVASLLHEQVEGKCCGRHGYVIVVTDLLHVGKGIFRKDGSGLATFSVKYQCVVMKPFVGEVLDCVVTTVTQMGFFAEAGPVNVFVSTHLIPEEYKLAAAIGQPSFQCADADTLSIKQGADIRLRIVGTKIDPSEIFCIGTMKEDFLGVLDHGVPVL